MGRRVPRNGFGLSNVLLDLANKRIKGCCVFDLFGLLCTHGNNNNSRRRGVLKQALFKQCNNRDGRSIDYP